MSVGTAHDPEFIEAYNEVEDDARLRGEYYVYRDDIGLVSGIHLTVTFKLAGTRRQVWQFLKDWNTWMNSSNYYFSAAIGELPPGATYRLAQDPNDMDGPHQYTLERVLPEYLIVTSQPIPESDDIGGSWRIGLGRVSAGYHAVTIEEFTPGTTEVSFFMDHASLMAEPQDADAMSVEEAIEPWRGLTESSLPRWRDDFIPTLRRLVAESAA